MYELTLTKSEIAAFQFVGNRYGNGDDMLDLIVGDTDIDEIEGNEITFKIPEHKAWGIADLAEQDNFCWPCFSPKLSSKMDLFCSSIV